MGTIDNLKKWWNTPTKLEEKEDPSWQMNRAQSIANIIMPLMAGVEAAASKGASPGTGTLSAWKQMGENVKGLKEHEQNLKKQALEEKLRKREEELYPMQQESLQLELAKKRTEKEEADRLKGKRTEYESIIKTPGVDIGKATEQWLAENDPKAYQELKSKQKSNGVDSSLKDLQTWIFKEEYKDKANSDKKAKEEEKKSAPLKRNIAALNSLAKKVPAKGPWAGSIEGLKANVGLQDDVKAYSNLFDGLKGNIARTYGGEKGVLSDQDIKRIDGFKFLTTDTPGVRKIKESFWNVMTSDAGDPEKILGALDQFEQVINGGEVNNEPKTFTPVTKPGTKTQENDPLGIR